MNFKFFTQLVEQYRTIIQVPAEVRAEVEQLADDVFTVRPSNAAPLPRHRSPSSTPAPAAAHFHAPRRRA